MLQELDRSGLEIAQLNGAVMHDGAAPHLLPSKCRGRSGQAAAGRAKWWLTGETKGACGGITVA